MVKRVRCQYRSKATDLEKIEILKFMDVDYISENAVKAIQCHQHSEWQIWFVLEGHAVVEIEGALMDAKPGDLFFIRGDVPHGLWTIDNASCHMFDIKFVVTEALFGSDTAKIQSNRLRQKTSIHRLVEKIIFELGDRKPGWELMTDIYLIELTVQALRSVLFEKNEEIDDKALLDRKLYHHFIVSQVKAYIETNYHRDLPINELADQVHLNPKYLSHIFKKVTGTVISKYLTEVRVKKAKELLQDSHLSIKEIALDVGFSNTSYFDRVFKKLEQISPCVYREHSD